MNDNLILLLVLLGLVGWGIAILFAMIRLRMARKQDRAARHTQMDMDPFSDITTTQTGSG